MPDEFGMRPGDVVGRGWRFGLRMRGTERIEPRVQFQSALVRLGNGKRERIVKRFRRTALNAGEIFRPRLDRRGIHRIGDIAHLEHHGVQVQLHRAVEQGGEFGLLLGDGQAGPGGPVNVRDRGDPRGAEFARRRRRRGAAQFVGDTGGEQQRRRQRGQRAGKCFFPTHGRGK